MNQPLDAIRISIKEQRLLQFRYHRLERVVLPMAVGVTPKGDWKLRGQQVAGRSASGSVGDRTPKLFDLDAIYQQVILETGFEIPVEYARGDTAFRVIDTEL